MTTRPDPFKTHVADQVLAALAETSPMPLSTPAIEVRTGYGRRYGQLVYTVLTRLAASGEVEKITTPGVKPVYWRRLALQVSLPDLAESGYDRHGRDCQCSYCATDEDEPVKRHKTGLCWCGDIHPNADVVELYNHVEGLENEPEDDPDEPSNRELEPEPPGWFDVPDPADPPEVTR